MPLVNRFTRLFRADVHAVLDRIEEPEALLRQAIREMDDDIDSAARRLKAREIERAQAEARLSEIRAARSRIESELDTCFAAGNEELARTMLRRKLEHERLAHRLEQHRNGLQRQVAELTVALDDQRRRLDALRQKAAIFDAAPERGDGAGWDGVDLAVTDADIEVALLRERQKRSTP